MSAPAWKTLPERERASHPDTPPDELERLCRRFPEEVLANPQLSLLSLVDPLAWDKIARPARSRAADRALFAATRGAPARRLRAFALACSERVLGLWARGPGPAEALSVARRCLEGGGTMPELARAWASVRELTRPPRGAPRAPISAESSAALSLRAALDAQLAADPLADARAAAEAAAAAVSWGDEQGVDSGPSVLEREWQLSWLTAAPRACLDRTADGPKR